MTIELLLILLFNLWKVIILKCFFSSTYNLLKQSFNQNIFSLRLRNTNEIKELQIENQKQSSQISYLIQLLKTQAEKAKSSEA